MLCAKFGWNWPSGSGEEDENVKSLRQRQQQGRQQRTNFDKKNSLGPLAQGAKNQVDVNVNNEQINIEYHTLFLIPDQGLALRGGIGPSP